ncbi:MAG: dipeptide epimerase [Phenylobacterium sp.]|uniref:N-acetyl-D-Glu racemase DgcA n=1 Tax=Phenylobacterium sp. TaxID=1871053 RepID=UPI0011FF8D7D|nr:N-acetyl-D-Glu racemase DgcA [Phenylobacterium sp.]TAJ72754.1 MAG: dipeptide epimerase [Phenylobacterium sp.]
MFRTLKAAGEHWPLTTPFRISRGARTQADLVVVEVAHGGAVGRGEGAPIPRYGDTVESCVAQLQALAPRVAAGLTRRELIEALPPGAARNALDCALWDLEARRAGRSVADLIGRVARGTVTTALTVGLGAPEEMGAAAAKLADYPLIKVKVNADDPAAQIAAVRAAAPDAVLIVDANEAWDTDLVRAMQPHLAAARVALLEQPLPAAEDAALAGFRPLVPICADESCHLAEDVPGLADRYQAVNIKLDKTGGLTAALDLLAAARAHGLIVMTGCMICTSLSVAPAFQVAEQSDFVDLDGPIWLAKDRDGGVRLTEAVLTAPDGALWGGSR